ncbi:hypothetical protein CR513_35768, partial [Mucuna pruriens]
MGDEDREFLKVIRHSENEMLDQLHKTPTQISLLSLLINSKSHHELLLRILNEAHVPQDIRPAKFGGIINNITASRHLSFSEEECENYMIGRVLIDKGSSLNVMPKTTLDKLYSPGAILRNSLVVLPIGLTLDTCRGGGPFIATPESQIHSRWTADQRHGRERNDEYIEEDEEALETSFQALEIVGTTSIETGRGDIKPSKAAIMAAKVITNDFKLGKGLGRTLDDMANPVAIQENPGRTGLGYSGAARKAKSGWKWGHRDSRTRGNGRKSTDGAENFPQINNTALAPDNADKSSRQDEEEKMEEEALRELERLLEQERPKLQSSTEELEIINLGKGEETR